jgi:hypothetical protein
MKTKLSAWLQSASFLVLAVTTANVQGQAQTAVQGQALSAKSAKAFAPLQAGTGIPVTPATPARQAPVKANKLMTPFDRVIAPHLAKFMAQGAKPASAATPKSSATAKSSATGKSSAIGAGGGNVNFPGFVAAPFLTINDGDRLSFALNSVSGDFNNDGRMDVATIRIDGTIDVILNPGSFASINNLTPITSSNNIFLYIEWVIVADMNGDGIPDLVGQDIANNQIVVWIGKGDGTFGAPNLYPVTLPPGVSWAQSFGASIVVGDFNGDGSLDVAAVTLNPNYVPGTSTTAIIEQTFLNVGQGRLSPLAVESSTFNDYYNTGGAPAYAEASVTTSDGINASSIAFLIFDQGINDSTKQGVSIATMASNGDGTFKPATEPAGPLVLNYQLNVVGAFISTNLGANVTSNPANKINPPGTPGSGTPTTDIVFITGDGAVYDAPFSGGNPTTAKTLVGLNTEQFFLGVSFVPPVTTPPTPPSLISTPIGSVGNTGDRVTMNVADMNGDGLLDLVVYTSGSVNIFPNAGNGVFTAAPAQLAGADPGFQQPQPANYDGGSYNSIVNVDAIIGQAGYFQNLGAAASTQAGQVLGAPLITGTNAAGNFETFGANIDIMATADVNGDGVLDLIGLDSSWPTYSFSNIVVGIRNGTGAGNQTSNYTFTTAVDGYSLLLISNDLVFIEPVTITNAAGTSILLVTIQGLYIVTAGSNGIFGTPTALNMGAQFDCAENLGYADVGDINGDGIPDIVVAYSPRPGFSCTQASTPSGYYTLLGNADGSFQPATFTPLGSALYAVKLINFSGAPGNLDLAAIDQNIPALSAAVYVIPNKADGSGTFNLSLATPPVVNYIVSAIVVGDYNSDGKQDLTLTTLGQINPSTGFIVPNTSGVLLLPGNGDYTFGTPTLVNPGHFPLWGSYADFNGDGAPDLALVEAFNNFISDAFTSAAQVLPNLGGGTFGPAIYLMDSYRFDAVLPLYTFTSYTFTGNFTNSGGADLLVSGRKGTAEFVNRGVTTLALVANPTSPAQGVTVTLTANISQAVSAGVADTGSVSFSANGTLLGSTPVAGGTATLTTTALAVGSNTIAATYAGDSNHNQASASMKLTVAPLTPAFTLTATPATLTLTRGATGTVTASLAANSTFSGTVTMGCSGAPSESTCIANPASITLLPGQSTPVSIVIATTPPNNSFAATLSGAPPWSGTLSGLGLAGVVFLRRPKRRRFSSVLGALAMVSLACGSAGLLNGCSGGGSKAATYPGTSTGQYTLTVTATSVGVSQTQAVALTVN